jgi:hypothetical protein
MKTGWILRPPRDRPRRHPILRFRVHSLALLWVGLTWVRLAHAQSELPPSPAPAAAHADSVVHEPAPAPAPVMAPADSVAHEPAPSPAPVMAPADSVVHEPALAPAPVMAPADSVAHEETPLIHAVRVEGNVTVDSARIVRTFEVHPGSRFSADAVRRGIQKRYLLGLFDDISPERIDQPDGTVDIVVHVVERPRISDIKFEGNKKRSKDELEKKLHLHSGEAYSPTAVEAQVDTFVTFYKEQGFPRAHVEAHTDTTTHHGQVGLTFVVTEGERVRITDIDFKG